MHRTIKAIIIVCAALVAELVHATEVKINLMECKTQRITCYAFDTQTFVIKSMPIRTGTIMRLTTNFSVQDDHLFVDGKKVTKAKQVLFQCHMDDVDLVVIRRIRISISNPLRLLFALFGHPVEMNEIAILEVAEGKLAGEREMIRKPSSYDWAATIMK